MFRITSSKSMLEIPAESAYGESFPQRPHINSLLTYVLAAVWGAGNSTIPLAAGPAHGTTQQELIIKIALFGSRALLHLDGFGALGLAPEKMKMIRMPMEREVAP
jgi:hypothetical protein